MTRSLCLILMTYNLVGCSPSNPKDLPSKIDTPNVYVVNFPLEYFAKRIGGDQVNVRFPAPVDVDPASWTPSAQDIVDFQSADLILLNGAGFAKWTNVVSLPSHKMVNTSEAFAGRFIDLEETFVHRHGPQGAKSDKEIVSTTWLDIDLARQQAVAIRDALIELRPDQKNTFEENFASLEQDLKKLDSDFMEVAQSLKGTPLMASNPIYQYMARRYQLNIKSVDWAPPFRQTLTETKQLDAILHDHQAKYMIWKAAPNESTRQLVEVDRGLKTILVSSLSNRGKGSSSDWLEAMNENLKALKSIKP